MCKGLNRALHPHIQLHLGNCVISVAIMEAIFGIVLILVAISCAILEIVSF